MKAYIVFRLKDPKAKKKEFIVDSIYTNLGSASIKMARIHKMSMAELITKSVNNALKSRKPVKQVFVTENQQTYIINKTIKGLINEI